MLSSSFVLFEFVCIALERIPTCFITDEDLGSEAEGSAGGNTDHILANLRREHEALDNQTALSSALQKLDTHFSARHSELPFSYDLNTRQFTSRDAEFIRFVAQVSARRSSGGLYAKQFETAACERLCKKVTGILHNVGYPRTERTTASQFRRYLQGLGFDNRVILGEERDGGLDILWFPPFGSHPVAPVVSLQCKNGLFSRTVARTASSRTAETTTTLSRTDCPISLLLTCPLDLATLPPSNKRRTYKFETSEQRSRNMRAIKGASNKTTELRLRAMLIKAGMRGWLIRALNFPGVPDFLFESSRVAIFVDGCFWHGCPRCGHVPRTNKSYWREKIIRNKLRDRLTTRKLKKQGFKVVRIWECQLRRRPRTCIDRILRALKGKP